MTRHTTHIVLIALLLVAGVCINLADAQAMYYYGGGTGRPPIQVVGGAGLPSTVHIANAGGGGLHAQGGLGIGQYNMGVGGGFSYSGEPLITSQEWTIHPVFFFLILVFGTFTLYALFSVFITWCCTGRSCVAGGCCGCCSNEGCGSSCSNGQGCCSSCNKKNDDDHDHHGGKKKPHHHRGYQQPQPLAGNVYFDNEEHQSAHYRRRRRDDINNDYDHSTSAFGSINTADGGDWYHDRSY